MASEKKITVKFFLNKKINVGVSEREPLFHLYARVIYNRQNTDLRAYFGWPGYSSMKEVGKREMKLEEALIKKIIRFDANDDPAYELKGLRKRYNFYSTSIIRCLDMHLAHKLKMEFMRLGDTIERAINFTSPMAGLAGYLKEITTSCRPQFKISPELQKDFDAYEFFRKKLDKQSVTTPEDYFRVIDWYNGTLLEKAKMDFPTEKEQTKRLHDLLERAVKSLER